MWLVWKDRVWDEVDCWRQAAKLFVTGHRVRLI